MEEVAIFSKCLYAAALSYVVAIGFIKFTILAFYWKLFSIAARWPIRILFISVVSWVITFVCQYLSPLPPASYPLSPECMSVF